MGYLFKERLCLSDRQQFNIILKELQCLVKSFVENAHKSHSTKTFLETNHVVEKSKFVSEAIILYLCKAIFMKFCLDNDFLPPQTGSENLYESVSEFYERFGKTYFNLSDDDLYKYYVPPTDLDLYLSDLLDKYNFSDVDTDLIGKLYEQSISREEKILLGQVYTPDEVVDYILERVGYKCGADLENKRIIDISCGSGVFLFRAANILIKNLKSKGYNCTAIFETLRNNIWGLDINPFSLKMAELNMLIAVFDILREIKRCDPTFMVQPFNLFLTNSVNKGDITDNPTVFCLKNRMGNFKNGFDFVVGNPPYLEAKKMPDELKAVCRENYPGICKGAFDLYFGFIKMALELLCNDGTFGYIIPNKVQVLKSAKWLRKHILENYSIEEITDISTLNVFKNISVYPVLLFIKNQKRKGNRIKTYDAVIDIESIKSGTQKPVEIKQDDFMGTGDFIFYTLPRAPTGLRIYEKMSSQHLFLKDYCDIRWTISFHKKNIINQFVFKEPKGINPKPILGADIHSRDSEVFPYRIVWNGFWIDYDREKAKNLGNPFPSKEIFETPKLIIRQNAEKLTAAIDSKGKWYLKDVFFAGRLTKRAEAERVSLEFIAGVLNSKLLNYYYVILFKGGHVNGGYLHFLVNYLNILPVVIPPRKDLSKITSMVNDLVKDCNEQTKRILDSTVCDIYGLSISETAFVLER
jgi:hypothetical protein